MQINKIIILGGGSSGWMTAAGLISRFPNKDITLIESANINTIGVGESTLAEINDFLKMLDVKDVDWMPFCKATYKLSIDFTNWDGKGTRFHYPFGFYPRYVEEQSPLKRKDQWFQRKLLCNTPPTEYAEFLWDTIELIDHNKFTLNEDKFFYNFQTTSLAGMRSGVATDRAYHFDASKFGEWLRLHYCEPRGVKHVLGTYTNAVQKENGYIDYINLKDDDTNYYADLFIDCTGFNSVLHEKVLNVPFNSFSDILINNKALATSIPYTDKNVEMETNTNATTMNAGWCWNIPLYNRIGTGYVYCSDFISEDEAEREFREYLLKHRTPVAGKEPIRDILHIDMKTGIRQEPWCKNVIAVGLSCGFIEPLESTGLLLTHKNITNICNALEMGDDGENVTGYLKQSFNSWIHADMAFASFIMFHYAFCKRNDTDYWEYVTNEVQYDGNIFPACEALNYYKDKVLGPHMFLENPYQSFQPQEALSVIMAGMDFNPLYVRDIKEQHVRQNADFNKTKEWLRSLDTWLAEKRAKNLKYVKTLPTHYEWLKQNIYNGEE